MSYTSWHVGMKVVCLHQYKPAHLRPSDYERNSRYPVEGGIYTVRDIRIIDAEVGILLEEIVNPIGNPCVGFDGESGFRAVHFRPVQKRKTDLSCFKRLLTDPHVKIREDA